MEAQEKAELADMIRKVRSSKVERRRTLVIAITLNIAAILCLIMLLFAFSYKAELIQAQQKLDFLKRELEECKSTQ